ncbi:MAG: uroporphyrinogen decarboxylase family protein [Victivallaceae bacterium]|nr:uroporphyrinogen decarboxylase family protein [Victivallaceae bacterium]
MAITLSEKENFICAIEFRQPEWIPIVFEIHDAVIWRYGSKLRDMMLRHPLIFGHELLDRINNTPPSGRVEEHRFFDSWSCEWLEVEPGIIGHVVGHPLAESWAPLQSLHVPDPVLQRDWINIRKQTAAARDRGELVHGYMNVIEDGFFDRLQFLRGLDNILMDFLDRPPELDELMAKVLDYNLRLIQLWLDAGIDIMHFHGDIGMQNGLMMSPATFRAVLKPAYARMFQTCRQAGVHVMYSSDGNLLEIVDDLIESGASCHDPQVRACTIDGIAKTYKGKLCAMVDIDEQMLPFCKPQDIHDQVRDIVAEIGSPQGGLMLFASPTKDVPLDNIEAICTAWEKYCLPGQF